MLRSYKDIMTLIREELGKQGHDAAWLADKMECRTDHVTDWLNDDAQPNVGTVIRMLETVGIMLNTQQFVGDI